MIQTFKSKTPEIAQSAYVSSSAVIIGEVNIQREASIWPMAVIRGDINRISIGERTNIQDGSVIHVTHAGPFNPKGYAVCIGNDVTVGHRAVLHGCELKDLCLIGIGSIVMDGACVESEVIVGAHSLVSPGKILKSGYLWLGSPAKQVRPLSDSEKAFLRYSAEYYVALAKEHARHG